MIEDETVHHLDGRRAVAEHERRGGECIEQLRELDRQHRLGRRQRHEIDPRRQHERERPFGPDDQPRQVERSCWIHELIEVVATDAPQDAGKPPADFIGMPRRQLAHRAIARAHQIAAGACGVEIRPAERLKAVNRAVGEHDFEIEDVIDRLPVQDRSRAARVVRDHPADRRAAGGGNVGSEPESVRPQRRVQLVEHDVRFDARPALRRVHLEQPIEVFRCVELKTGADRLARLRRPTAARGD